MPVAPSTNCFSAERERHAEDAVRDRVRERGRRDRARGRAGRLRTFVRTVSTGITSSQYQSPPRAEAGPHAKRALIPIENKRNFLDVSAEIMEHVDPIFFGDPKMAALKVMGAT